MGLPTPQEERYYEHLRQKRRSLFSELNQKDDEQAEIIFIGDSITEFFPITKYLKTNTSMANRGIAASRTDHILEHISLHVYGNRLRQVILLIGVNDLGYGIAHETTLQNVRQIIDRILDDYPFIKITLLELLPVSQDEKYAKTVGLRTNDAILALNDAYATIANTYFNVELVPLYKAFLDDQQQLAERWTLDGLHLSQEGYQQLAKHIAPYLA